MCIRAEVENSRLIAVKGVRMDGSRFDKLVRSLASGTSRRSALKGAVGSAGASLLALLGRGESEAQQVGTAASCRGTGDNCRRNALCCSRRCRNGKCQCRGDGGRCFVDRACCSGRCRQGECAGDGPLS